MAVEPSSIRAGSTVEWERTLDYSAANGYCAVYSIRGPVAHNLTGTGSGATYTFALSNTDTVNWPPGTYWWVLAVEHGSPVDERYAIDSGQFEVLPDLAATGPNYDGRSHVKRTLDALEATILGKASKDQSSMSIAGRSVSRLSPEELLTWRDRYRREYQAELQALQLADGDIPRNVYRVRFDGG